MAYRITFTFVLALFFNTGYGELRDPTRPDYQVQNPASTESIKSNQETKLTLSGIWITPHSRRAVINGINVIPGDIILNEVQIIAINENRVTIKVNGITKTLHLHQRSYIPR